MKKLFLLLTCLFLVVGCGNNESNTNEEESVENEEQEVVETVEVDPNDVLRIGGYAMDEDLPVAVWVDFDSTNDKVAKVTLTGYGNPAVMETYGDKMNEYFAAKDSFIGKTADELKDQSTTVLDSAMAFASESYLTCKDQFVIRPYQSLMAGRYAANNPYIVENTDLAENVEIETELVASYPENAATLVTEDVMNPSKEGEVKFPEGKNIAKFTNDSETEYTISTGVALANEAGIAVVSYTYGDLNLVCPMDIYDNFTVGLEGQDAYGKVIGVVSEDDNVVTYRVLGDKAMNFPGGTCGSTVVDVTINKTDKTIVTVNVYEASDSTYLANAWEYNGGFAGTGEFIKAIDQYTAKFEGLDASKPLSVYELTTKENPNGGQVVEGGVDMVVTGATRTSNAIIYAVNAVIEEFNK